MHVGQEDQKTGQMVRRPLYPGTTFHRVIPGFMIQGGGFEPGMQQKPTKAPIKNEADNGLKNERYTIAMARTSDPHSASSQFFINVGDNSFLDHKSPTPDGWGYCVFGKVVQGQEVVDKIKGVVVDDVREFLENGNVTRSVNFPETVLHRTRPHRVAIPHKNVPNMVAQILTALAAQNIPRGQLQITRNL